MTDQTESTTADPNAQPHNPAQAHGHPTTSPHITQAPTASPVPYDELPRYVGTQRSVHNGVRALVQGVRQQLEQLAGDDSKDANILRDHIRQVAGSLDADAWARAVVENTPAKGGADPQSNASVAPQINR